MDEKAFRKGHNYLTLVNDLRGSRVLYVAEDREQKKSGWILGNADGGTKSRRASIFSGGITGRPIADEEGRRHAEAAIREHHYLPDPSDYQRYQRVHQRHDSMGEMRGSRISQQNRTSSTRSISTVEVWTWLLGPTNPVGRKRRQAGLQYAAAQFLS
jgi:hypothetical protein